MLGGGTFAGPGSFERVEGIDVGEFGSEWSCIGKPRGMYSGVGRYTLLLSVCEVLREVVHNRLRLVGCDWRRTHSGGSPR